MSDQEVVTLFTDGASRGNPGPAAFAYVIKRNGQPDIEEHGILPDTTNTIAEYTALVRGLEHARRLGARRVAVSTDSELMVRQIDGSYRVKNEGLKPLYERATALLREFDSANVKHVPRGHNAHADRLCNEALDRGKKKVAAPKKAAQKTAPAARQDIREQAIDCLRSVAAAWALGNPNNPKPEDVWDQLWSILEEGGALRK
jgi:ribonuclease HI